MTSNNTGNIKEIRVAIYTDEQEDEEFYGPYGRTCYFMWALSEYSWTTGGETYCFAPTLVSTEDILNNKLTLDSYDVLLYPPNNADGNILRTGFSNLPRNVKLRENIISFIKEGGGYFGTCAGAIIACSLQNQPNTFFEQVWSNSCLNISTCNVEWPGAFPILSQWLGYGPEAQGLAAYITYSGWNQSNYTINYYSGVCLDVKISTENPIFQGYEAVTRKIRWVSGPALEVPASPDREIYVLATYPEQEISDNISTRIHYWKYNGGLVGLLKGMFGGEGEIHYWEHLGIFMRAFVFAEDWTIDDLVETNLADKPFMTAEIYPNQNQARIVLCSGHPEYNVWWGGHIEEVEDTNHNNIYDGLHHWKDMIPEEETIQDEFSYNYWIIRRSVAWAANLPETDLPPIDQ